MKKKYYVPEVEITRVRIEECILSTFNTGTSSDPNGVDMEEDTWTGSWLS